MKQRKQRKVRLLLSLLAAGSGNAMVGFVCMIDEVTKNCRLARYIHISLWVLKIHAFTA